jgi:hypothetical protein
MKKKVEVRGIKAVFLKTAINWDAVPVGDQGGEYKFPVVAKDGKIVELRPGAVIQLTRPLTRVNLYYTQEMGPVDLVPSKDDPYRARIIKRWKFKF